MVEMAKTNQGSYTFLIQALFKYIQSKFSSYSRLLHVYHHIQSEEVVTEGWQIKESTKKFHVSKCITCLLVDLASYITWLSQCKAIK